MPPPRDTLEDFAAFAHRLADAARAETLPRFRQAEPVENKDCASFDPVTDADREGERKQRALIAETYPDHAILGEEFGLGGGAGPWRWVLDPVDGTRAFVCGTTSWTTLIALENDGEPALGLIDQPFTDERWIGYGGEAVYIHRGETRPCRASGCEDLSAARLSTTDPRAEGYFSTGEAEAFSQLSDRARVCRFSLDAYAYALLAMGELDLVIETGLQRHDYAPFAPIISAAGGVLSNWSGAPLGSDGRGEIVAAASPALHEAALKALAG